jgi:hypothetical protein
MCYLILASAVGEDLLGTLKIAESKDIQFVYHNNQLKSLKEWHKCLENEVSK